MFDFVNKLISSFSTARKWNTVMKEIRHIKCEEKQYTVKISTVQIEMLYKLFYLGIHTIVGFDRWQNAYMQKTCLQIKIKQLADFSEKYNEKTIKEKHMIKGE